MIQDIAPHIYDNQYSAALPEPDSVAIYIEKDQALMTARGGELRFPAFGALPGPWKPATYIFSIDGTAYFLLAERPECDPEDFCMERIQVFREQGPRHLAFAGITAAQLYRWYKSRRYCGHCRAEMKHSPEERCMVCPDCGAMEYPKLSPAVIVAVTDGENLLLSRYANSPPGRYALVAGFAEIGESIEDTVRREVLEETGLKVKNLRFYKSQPWSFTDCLLFGFYCELDGSPEITVDEKELAEAKWFRREDVPPATSDISLTSEMIEAFRQRNAGPNAAPQFMA